MQPVTQPAPRPRGPSVLVVDDELTNRAFLKRVLTHDGYEVITADDGSAALALTLSMATPPDLVILDFMMPGMNGPDVARQMRAQGRMRDVPILLLTSSALNAHVEEGLAAGVDDYLIRTTDRHILGMRMQAALRAREDRRRAAIAEVLQLQRDALVAELEEAGSVQRAQIPREALAWPGFRAAGAMLPWGAVGGDLFDVLEGVDGHRVAVLLDVAGHGVGAALVASSLHAQLRVLMRLHRPAAALSLLNDQMFDEGSPKYACVAAVETGPEGVTIVNAGLPPVCVGRAGELRATVEASGMPMGLFPARTYASEHVPLSAGDRVVLMSDGLNEPFGPSDDVRSTIEALALFDNARFPSDDAGAVATRLRSRIAAAPEPARDDVTLLLLEATA